MQRNLKMIFTNSTGKTVTITVPNVKDGATAAEVKTAMTAVLAGNAFHISGGDLTAIKSASIVSTDTEEVTVI